MRHTSGVTSGVDHRGPVRNHHPSELGLMLLRKLKDYLFNQM